MTPAEAASKRRSDRQAALLILRTLESSKYELKRHGPELDDLPRDFTDEEIDRVQEKALEIIRGQQNMITATLSFLGEDLTDQEKAEIFWNE